MRRRPKLWRALRWGVFVAAGLALWFGVLSRFRISRLTYPYSAAMGEALAPGRWYLVDLRPPERLEVGWIVWWRTEAGAAAFSRVFAAPGETLARREGRWCVAGAEGGERPAPPELRLAPSCDGRRLGARSYFLVNDRLDAPFADSRRLGAVPRARVGAHVVLALGGGS